MYINYKRPAVTEQKARILVVFDWDDTLFPTAEFGKFINNNFPKLSQKENKELYESSKSVYLVLKKYIDIFSSQNISIITSSQNGWVRQSLVMMTNIAPNTFYRHIYNLLFVKYQINIIHPDRSYIPFKTKKDNVIWKCNAFRSLFTNFFVANHNFNSAPDYRMKIILSIGDGNAEYIGSKQAANQLFSADSGSYRSEYLLHRIKLIQKPKLYDMIHEMQLINKLCDKLEIFNKLNKEINIDYGAEKQSFSERQYIEPLNVEPSTQRVPYSRILFNHLRHFFYSNLYVVSTPSSLYNVSISKSRLRSNGMNIISIGYSTSIPNPYHVLQRDDELIIFGRKNDAENYFGKIGESTNLIPATSSSSPARFDQFATKLITDYIAMVPVPKCLIGSTLAKTPQFARFGITVISINLQIQHPAEMCNKVFCPNDMLLCCFSKSDNKHETLINVFNNLCNFHHFI